MSLNKKQKEIKLSSLHVHSHNSTQTQSLQSFHFLFLLLPLNNSSYEPVHRLCRALCILCTLIYCLWRNIQTVIRCEHISATAADHASLSVAHSCTLLSPHIHAAQPHCREINSIIFLRNMVPSLHRDSLQGLHSHTIPHSLSFTPLTVSAF